MEAYLKKANLRRTILANADLLWEDLLDIQNWQKIQNMSNTNIEAVKNAPVGFIEFAKSKGAIEKKS